MEEILQDPRITSLKKLKKKLYPILNQHKESVKIMTSSGKLLDFLINDILDFAQLRAGKFRMRVASFDLREAIEEIILIQQYKAE